ncbi:hypothetical protein AB0M68_16430 [Streptomyces sp. NPDC051453]|uniref:hypothetical protein n=1 Tax=Streptomyces sp. NPDC051453 TaxID=3154941 RepID=UPI003418877E
MASTSFQDGLRVASATRPALGHEFGVLSGPFEGDDGDGRDKRMAARRPRRRAIQWTGPTARAQHGPGVVRHAGPYERSSADRT